MTFGFWTSSAMAHSSVGAVVSLPAKMSCEQHMLSVLNQWIGLMS
jgi:hypothetical protein